MMKLFSKQEEESQVQSAIVLGQYRDTVTMTTLCGEVSKAHDEEAPRLRKYVERQLQTCDVLAHFADVARQQPVAPRCHDNANTASTADGLPPPAASSSSSSSKKKKNSSDVSVSAAESVSKKETVSAPFALYADAVRATAALKRTTADALSDLGDATAAQLSAPLAAASLKLAQVTANKKNLDKLEANVDTARKKHEALKAKKAKTAPEKLTAALNDEAEALVAFEDAQTTLEAELVRVNDAVCTDGATAMVALLCAHDVFLNSVSVALDAALKAVTPLANTSVEQLLKDKRLPRLAAMRHRDEFDDAVDDDDVVRRAKEKLQAEYDQKLAKAILALETTANEREAVRADELADLESTKASAKAMRAELADEKVKFEQQKADAEARIAKLNSDAEREYERLRQTRLKELDRLKAEAKGEKAESDSDDDAAAAAKDGDAADSDSEESGDSNALCERCHLPIVGDVVEAMGAQWHDACFVCNSCGCDLSGGFVRYEGKPSCVSCKKKAVQKQKDDAAAAEAAAAEAEDKEKEKSRTSEAAAATTTTTTTTAGTTATTDGEAALKCASCQLAIKGDQLDDAVRALDRDWHAKCFRCAVCKEELRYGYIRVEDGAWCRDCRKKDKDERKAKKSAK